MTIVMKRRYDFTQAEIDAMQRGLRFELGLAPSPVRKYPDKYYNSDARQRMNDRGIKAITAEQMRLLHAVAAEAGYNHAQIKEHRYGDYSGSLTTLTAKEADRMILRYQREAARNKKKPPKLPAPAPLPRHGFGNLPKPVQRPAGAVPTPAPVKAAAPRPTAPRVAVAAAGDVSETPKAGFLKPDGSGRRWTTADEIPW